MTAAGRLARHTGTNTLHGLLAAGCGVVIAGLMFRRLGAEYGVAALVINGMVQLNLFEEGVGTFVVTHVSRQRREESQNIWTEERLRGLGAAVSTYLVGSLALALIVGIALWLLFAPRHDAALLGLYGGMGLGLVCIANLMAKMLEGREDYVLLRAVQTAVNVLRVLGVTVLYLIGSHSITDYVLWFVLTSGIMVSVMGYHLPGRTPDGLLRATRRAGLQEYKDLARYARPLLVAKGASVVSYRLDLWIVQVVAGSTASTAYAMADALVGFATRAIDAFRTGLLPVSVQSWRHDDPVWIRTFVLRASKASVVLVGAVSVGMVAALEPLLLLWFGEAPVPTLLAARLLLLFVALTAFRSAVQAILAGQNQFHRMQIHFVLAAFINFVFSLAATVQWGAWGPALGTAVGGCYLLWASLGTAERTLELPQGILLRNLLRPGLLALVCGATAGSLLQFGGPNWLQIVGKGFVAVSTFGVIAWFSLLATEERVWVRSVAFGRLIK